MLSYFSQRKGDVIALWKRTNDLSKLFPSMGCVFFVSQLQLSSVDICQGKGQFVLSPIERHGDAGSG